MARDFYINGESLVRVKLGAHLLNNPLLDSIKPTVGTAVFDLGLCAQPIRIMPRTVHHDLKADDFGPEIPADVISMLADCKIFMKLIHYDRVILDMCLAEATGGIAPLTVSSAGAVINNTNSAGIFVGAGRPMGGAKLPGANGNHYVSLNILSEVADFPYRFRSSYLIDRFELPLGTSKSEVDLTWRAIPYVFPLPITGGMRGEYVASEGANLWDHVLDT